MKRASLVIVLATTALIAACSNVPRSRDLANPNVAAITIAQQVCSDCHGVTGNSISPNFPKLSAQTPAYLVAQLKGFRNHNRADPAGFVYMWGLSRSLTDEQITGLATYYSNQNPTRLAGNTDTAGMATGKQIFETGVVDKNIPACVGCHGATGQGNDAFPRLAGQHADYIVKQLIVFQRTDERPDGAIMKTVAHDLALEEIRSLAAYLQSL